MVKIEKIHIHKFRGIKDLQIDFEKENWVILGKNGSGKSGVVDAIEFVLTGNIKRLEGAGMGGITVKTHAPHIDSRSTPKDSLVKIVLFLTSLNKYLEVIRTSHTPNKYKLSDNSAPVKELFESITLHPEFVLSRREILKYILTVPSERSKNVQTLLRLETIDKIRSSLQTITNTTKREHEHAQRDHENVKTKLLEILKIDELKSEKVLCSANSKRKILGLLELLSLEKDTSLKEGIDAKVKSPTDKIINKEACIKDVDKLLTSIEGLPDFYKQCEELDTILEPIKQKPELLKGINKQNFYELGLKFLTDPSCPFCEKEWDINELKRQVTTKIEEAKEVLKLKNDYLVKAKPVKDSIYQLIESLKAIKTISENLKLAPTEFTFDDWLTPFSALYNSIDDMGKVCEKPKLLDFELSTDKVIEYLKSLKTKVDGLPDTSKSDSARDFLILSDERLTNYREAKGKLKTCETRRKHTDIAIDKFNASSENVLVSIYNDVEKDFSRYYCEINKEDESSFNSRFVPSSGSLDFEVDFYGRGTHPPVAYHSEGHQDSMGLCLYFALMKKLQGTNFTFAVLDDILMSVDSSHRKSVCRLLKKEFSNTQFIFTTHDKVWQRQMITEGLVAHKTSLKFVQWSVENGPIVLEEKDSWEEIKNHIEKDNIKSAAHCLRYHIECMAHELASRIGAKVTFNQTGDYDGGELLDGTITRYIGLLKTARKVAHKWKKSELIELIDNMTETFKNKLSASKHEQWTINPAIHFNDWDNLDKPDFVPVVEAFKELLETFKCLNCNTLIYTLPYKGSAETLRCQCDEVHLNLLTG